MSSMESRTDEGTSPKSSSEEVNDTANSDVDHEEEAEEAKREIAEESTKKSKEKGKEGTKKRHKSKKHRRKKPGDAPRRPLSAYNIYFREERASLIRRSNLGEPDEDFTVNLDAIAASGKKRGDPSAVFQAAARTLADRWKAMSTEEKVSYEKSAKEDMEKYRNRLAEYETRMVEEARQKSAYLSTQKKKDGASELDTSMSSQASQSAKVDCIVPLLPTQVPQLASLAAGNSLANAAFAPGIQIVQTPSGPVQIAAPNVGQLAYPQLQAPIFQQQPALFQQYPSVLQRQPSLQLLGAAPHYHQLINPVFSTPALSANNLYLLQSNGQPLIATQARARDDAASETLRAVPTEPSLATGSQDQSTAVQNAVLMAVQRHHPMEQQLSLARAANAPVATVLPSGIVDPRLLAQFFGNRQRVTLQGGQVLASSSSGAPPHPPHAPA